MRNFVRGLVAAALIGAASSSYAANPARTTPVRPAATQPTRPTTAQERFEYAKNTYLASEASTNITTRGGEQLGKLAVKYYPSSFPTDALIEGLKVLNPSLTDFYTNRAAITQYTTLPKDMNLTFPLKTFNHTRTNRTTTIRTPKTKTK